MPSVIVKSLPALGGVEIRPAKFLSRQPTVANDGYVALAAIREYLQRLGTSRPPYRFAVLGFSFLVRRFDQPKTEAAFL